MAPRIDLPGPLGRIDVPLGWRRPCSVNHWGEGVLVAATPAIVTDDFPPYLFFEVPYGIASDGHGGAFVLATATELWPHGSQGHATFRHVSAAGAAGPRVFLSDPIYYAATLGLWPEAAIVASGKRRVIAAASDHTHDMSAQRYDESGAPLWTPKTGIRLTTPYPGGASFVVANIAGEEDGSDGAIFAWRETNAAGASEVRAQRIDRNGNRRWGTPRAPRIGPIAGTVWGPPQPWMQLVATGKGGAIVVAPEASGTAFRYVATPIGATGAVGAPTTLVVSAPDDWRAYHRIRYAVPDGAGGMFFGRADVTGNVRLMRYTPSTGIRFDIATGMVIDPLTLAVREDDRGGVLVGGIGGTPTALRLRRYDANGAVTWDIDAGALPLQVAPVPGASMNRVWITRSVTPLPDGNGGAIVLVHELMPYPGPFVVVTRCFDAQGRLVSGGVPLTSDDWGQTMPLATPAGVERAIVAYTQYENLDESGYDVSAQRVGCCAPVGDVPPPPAFGCEILPLPGMGPGRFAFDLPCGNEARGFGVIPLSRFVVSVPGLRAPAGLASHDAPAPAWARLMLRGVPDGMTVALCTLGGKRVAGAKPLPAMPGIHTLTFKPPNEADLLVVVSVAGTSVGKKTWAFDVTIESGDGQPSALTGAMPRPKGRKPARR